MIAFKMAMSLVFLSLGLTASFEVPFSSRTAPHLKQLVAPLAAAAIVSETLGHTPATEPHPQIDCSPDLREPCWQITSGAMPAVAADAVAATDLGAGESVFTGNCAACHRGGMNVIMPEKTLQKAALEEYLTGGFNEAAVIKQVTNGKNAMPAFGGRLSDEDIANVAAYVISTASTGWES